MGTTAPPAIQPLFISFADLQPPPAPNVDIPQGSRQALSSSLSSWGLPSCPASGPPELQETLSGPSLKPHSHCPQPPQALLLLSPLYSSPKNTGLPVEAQHCPCHHLPSPSHLPTLSCSPLKRAQMSWIRAHSFNQLPFPWGKHCLSLLESTSKCAPSSWNEFNAISIASVRALLFLDRVHISFIFVSPQVRASFPFKLLGLKSCLHH